MAQQASKKKSSSKSTPKRGVSATATKKKTSKHEKTNHSNHVHQQRNPKPEQVAKEEKIHKEFCAYHSLSVKTFQNEVVRSLRYRLSKDPQTCTRKDMLQAVSWAIKNHLVDHWIETRKHYREVKPKAVFYVSLEFLTGQTLMKSIFNLDLYQTVKQAVENLGFDLEDIATLENDAALGNGGLGRLAACYLDSMASVGLPSIGYGLRYEYGIFRQDIEDGYQKERPENWLKDGNPWEIRRPECNYTVQFYGRVKTQVDEEGKIHYQWVETEKTIALAYDTPFPGFHRNNVNTLRLWSSEPTQEFNLDYFNHGDYIRAVEDKASAKSITRVLYPNDHIESGLELRLRQEYFLVSATLQDIIKRYKHTYDNFDQFPEQIAIQLNDTHPSLAIPELMRLLIDVEGFSWNKAWFITVHTMAYTNHTILPEALEKWPVTLLEKLLPRHMQIIYEINRRFLRYIANSYPGDTGKLSRMSLFEEGPIKKVNMAHLAIVGSHAVNGVSELHTKILKNKLFKDFVDIHPDRFFNKTNGITPRRWLVQANRGLSQLITDTIGDNWKHHLDDLKQLTSHAEDGSFRKAWREVKQKNKEMFADFVMKELGIQIDPQSIFDCQVKRIHEYKRQLLNILHVIYCYNEIKRSPQEHHVPRTFIFAGKSAPSYEMAKLTIKLINTVGEVVNNDPAIENRIKVVFIPDYRVSVAEKIMPAADLSEQISTAGFEASGTGNMKLAINGALTIGTLDGANIEIKQEVGEDNIFIFGMTASEVEDLRIVGYNPKEIYQQNPDLKKVLDMIDSGFFCLEEPDLFKPIVNNLLTTDYFCVLADFASYVSCQRKVSKTYADQELWTKKSIYNTANMGKFSADRAVMEYAQDIWHAHPVDVPLPKLPHRCE